jgi:DNA repair protein RadA/Sms
VARTRSVFTCGTCGYQSPRWLGRCPDCGEWNTLVEERAATPTPSAPVISAPPVVLLDVVEADSEARVGTGFGEFDRVLGGGLVAGSLVLLGGEPGIGKSTILLQTLAHLEASGIGTLLVSGEESPGQVKLRARRLTSGSATLALLTETQVELVVACLEEHRPGLCVVDSVQTLWSEAVSSAPGSVAQIREATGRLLRVAKDKGVTIVLVGHVTKEGDLAGPRVLEHMVDTVLAFEGDRTQPYRILRAVKNRFGPTNEVGVFQMTGKGLVDVPDPSALFLEDGAGLPGSSVAPAMEGTRCLLAEVQALVTPTRLAMVVAVLARRAGLGLGECDVFVNVAGGLTVEDPGVDLAVALAIASGWRDRPLEGRLAAFGEVSLTGRLRYVVQGEQRLAELTRHGFDRVLLPRRNAEEARAQGGVPAGVELLPVDDLGQALRATVG